MKRSYVITGALLTLFFTLFLRCDVSAQSQGTFETAAVYLDGSLLFTIAAPAQGSPNQLPIKLRRAYVETALRQVVTSFKPHDFQMRIRREGKAVLLEAVESRHSQAVPIITVTPADAEYARSDLQTLATLWQGTLQHALRQSLDLRQPEVERHSLATVARAAAALLLLSIAVWQLVLLLRRMDRFAIAGEIAIWTLAVLWLAAARWALSLFPPTTALAARIEYRTFGLATTIVAVGITNRVLDIAIFHATQVWALATARHAIDRERQRLRAPTIARTLSGFKTLALLFVAILSILGQLGIPVASVVTIGGLTAVALSLAAQNFVRDFLNGFLVLIEDQYVVGDYVTINSFSGIVEKLTLRMAQVRDIEGSLTTIPHSSVTAVVNQSRNWSRVNLRLPVDPRADVRRA
ncbi:MAG: mechanosensitive ion channel family protein, partial [Vulcanimicrobiaceae bacterium]